MHSRISDLPLGFGRLWEAVRHCSASLVVFASYGADFTSRRVGSQRLWKSSFYDLCFSIRKGRVVTAEQRTLSEHPTNICSWRDTPFRGVIQSTWRR